MGGDLPRNRSQLTLKRTILAEKLGSRLDYKEGKEVTGSEKMEVTAIEHLLERYVLLKKKRNMILAGFLKISL